MAVPRFSASLHSEPWSGLTGSTAPILRLLPERLTISTEVMDRDGALLRAYATPDGYWRLNTRIEDVDPKFVKMLIAYEDKRFYDHGGIDGWALLRAAYQLAGAAVLFPAAPHFPCSLHALSSRAKAAASAPSSDSWRVQSRSKGG